MSIKTCLKKSQNSKRFLFHEVILFLMSSILKALTVLKTTKKPLGLIRHTH